MAFSCPQCLFEKGMTVNLSKINDGSLVCPNDYSHRYKVDGSGFLRTAKQ